jgi:hypothetical protein
MITMCPLDDGVLGLPRLTGRLRTNAPSTNTSICFVALFERTAGHVAAG